MELLFLLHLTLCLTHGLVHILLCFVKQRFSLRLHLLILWSSNPVEVYPCGAVFHKKGMVLHPQLFLTFYRMPTRVYSSTLAPLTGLFLLKKRFALPTTIFLIPPLASPSPRTLLSSSFLLLTFLDFS